MNKIWERVGITVSVAVVAGLAAVSIGYGVTAHDQAVARERTVAASVAVSELNLHDEAAATADDVKVSATISADEHAAYVHAQAVAAAKAAAANAAADLAARQAAQAAAADLASQAAAAQAAQDAAVQQAAQQATTDSSGSGDAGSSTSAPAPSDNTPAVPAPAPAPAAPAAPAPSAGLPAGSPVPWIPSTDPQNTAGGSWDTGACASGSASGNPATCD